MKLPDKIDVIILARSDSEELISMTADCIESIRKNDPGIDFNIILIESGAQTNYDVQENIVPDIDFNFNAYINIGLKYCKSDYVVLSNNDTYYHPGWATNIISEMQKNDLLSASPYCENTHKDEFGMEPFSGILEGYQIRVHVAGWCIVQDRRIYDLIPKEWDEQFEFWCSDCDYAAILQKNKIRHALVGSSRVDHLGGGYGHTIRTRPHDEQIRFTGNTLADRYRAKWNVT